MSNAGDARDAGLIPGGGNGNPLQYSCLENPMDRGAWWATVHGVANSGTRPRDWAHTTQLIQSLWTLGKNPTVELLNQFAISVDLSGYKQERVAWVTWVKRIYRPLWIEGEGGDWGGREQGPGQFQGPQWQEPCWVLSWHHQSKEWTPLIFSLWVTCIGSHACPLIWGDWDIWLTLLLPSVQ